MKRVPGRRLQTRHHLQTQRRHGLSVIAIIPGTPNRTEQRLMWIALQWQHVLPPPRLFEEVSVLPLILAELSVVDDVDELIERLPLLPLIEELALCMRGP